MFNELCTFYCIYKTDNSILIIKTQTDTSSSKDTFATYYLRAREYIARWATNEFVCIDLKDRFISTDLKHDETTHYVETFHIHKVISCTTVVY